MDLNNFTIDPFPTETPAEDQFVYLVQIDTFLENGDRLPDVYVDLRDETGDLIIQLNSGAGGSIAYVLTRDTEYTAGKMRADFSKAEYQSVKNFLHPTILDEPIGNIHGLLWICQILTPE
jgi:hypothetical protein